MPVSYFKTIDEAPEMRGMKLPLCDDQLLGLLVKGSPDKKDADTIEAVVRTAFQHTRFQITMLRIISVEGLNVTLGTSEPISVVSIGAKTPFADMWAKEVRRGMIISSLRRAFPKQAAAL